MAREVEMEIYVTKYALTTGIIKHDAEVTNDMAVVHEPNSFGMYFHGEGKDWHKTKESALERAEEMRIRKLQSLDKQTKKISAMIFEAP